MGRSIGRGGAFAAALLLVVLVAGCSPARLGESVALLRALSSTEAGGGEAVARRAVSFTVDGEPHAATLYTTAAARADLILVPGPVPAGGADPRLVAFAETLARARFRVLVPELERMRALQVSHADAAVLAGAARYLKAAATSRPLGTTAVSFAVGPAVLAVDAGAPVDFVVAIGGYYDLEAAIAYFTTGYYRAAPGEPWRYREPNAYGKWVFVLSNAPRLDDARDRDLLERMARRRLADPSAAIAPLVAELGPAGRAVHALITNDDPERVPALIRRLPEGIRAEIDALNLTDVDFAGWARRGVDAEFVLVHGRGDPVIPATQSEALARALGAERSRLYLVQGLGHVEPEGVGLAGSLQLLAATYRVLTLRDRGGAG